MNPNVPSIFDTYKSFENDGPELNLRILKPLDANTRSVEIGLCNLSYGFQID